MPEPETTVLVVDDEEPILLLAQEALEAAGYAVLAASSGKSAIELTEAHAGSIGLFLVDVVMPDINGPELAEKLCELQPEAKLIFTSGYGLGAETALKRRSGDVDYLRKPFGVHQLNERVSAALRQPA